MRQESYETILRAVGRVLDAAEARSFAVRETDTGLLVELTGETGNEQYHLSLGDVSTLLDWQGTGETAPRYELARSSDEGTLKGFLERHQHELADTHA
ncbi:MAG TPA: hypothetical protein VFU63_05405 [Ktedonobacterales bacterium]|nr:hypothetical protein [Ktedonobacterales bacterium]